MSSPARPLFSDILCPTRPAPPRPIPSRAHRSESSTLSYDLDCESVDEVATANRGSLFALNELLDMFCPPWAKTVYELSIAALLLMCARTLPLCVRPLIFFL